MSLPLFRLFFRAPSGGWSSEHYAFTPVKLEKNNIKISIPHSGAAAGILIDQKISQKRKDDRATENILTRQHTIIQTNITPEEEKAMLEQFQQNMLKRQSTIVESRKSQMQKILERKSQLKEKQQERKAAEVEKALLAMDREKTMMINTRKSQSTGLENRLDTLRLERTMTQARKSQGGLNFANQGKLSFRQGRQ